MLNINNGNSPKESKLYDIFSLSLSQIIKMITNEDRSSSGLIGLINLGNTCFMNSALQCLSNTPKLTKYFLTETYLKELNPKTDHEVSKSYHELLKVLWLSEETDIGESISPANFRGVFIGYAKQFSNYGQHDAQEFLIYLLDKIHDDLNRIIEKPYISINNEDEDNPDECWNRYKMRDNSVIVDLFQGQLKNKIICDVCGHVSNNYDPFMMMSLPIPQGNRIIKVIFIDLDYKIYNYNYTLDEDNFNEKELKSYLISSYKKEWERTIEPRNIDILLIDQNCNVAVVIDYYKDNTLEANEDKIIDTTYRIIAYEKREINVYVSLNRFITKNKYFFIPYVEVDVLSYPIPIHVASNSRISELHKKFEKITGMNDFNFYVVNYLGIDPCPYCGMIGCKYCNLLSRFTLNESIKYIISRNSLSSHLILYGEFPHQTAFSNEVSQIIKQTQDILFTNSTLNEENNKSISIYDCINLFLKEEKLKNENKWYCPKCKTHQEANQKMDIYKYPQYLIIQFKRFKTFHYSELPEVSGKSKKKCGYSFLLGNHSYSQKNNINVTYPLEGLNLTKFIIGPNGENAIYDLYGVLQHYGGVSFGHYISTCKNDIDNNWYEYNDSNISKVKPSEVENNNGAYLLFYKLKSN